MLIISRRKLSTKRLVGTVCESSSIEKIKFEYSFKVPVSEGDLVEAVVGGTKVMYQIVEDITDTETLESRNEAGVIVGEAIQLGLWNGDRRLFERFGWVPSMNSPILLAADPDFCCFLSCPRHVDFTPARQENQWTARPLTARRRHSACASFHNSGLKLTLPSARD